MSDATSRLFVPTDISKMIATLPKQLVRKLSFSDIDLITKPFREEIEKLRGVLEDLCRKHWDTGLDSEDFDGVMRTAGLFVTVPASDEIRAEFDCETMDTWAWSDLTESVRGGS